MFSLSFQIILLYLMQSALSELQNQCILVPLQGSKAEATTELLCNNSFSVMKVQHSNLLHYILPHSSQEQQLRVNRTTSCSNVVGVIGEVDSETASVVSTLAGRLKLDITIVSVIAPTTFQPLVNVGKPNVLDMNPLIHYIQTSIKLMDQLNWTRVGLITDGSYYYQSAAELLQQMVFQTERRMLVPYIRLPESFSQALKMIQVYETRVIIIFTNKKTACSILEEAQRMGLIWPDYGWLILDSESGDSIKSICSFEGTIILKDFFIKSPGGTNSSSKESGKNFCSKELTPSVFFDSILAVATKHKGVQVFNATFEGRNGLVKFRNGNRLSNISVIQVTNGSELEIARYDSNTQLLMLNVDIRKSDSPRGGVLIVRSQNTTSHIVLFSILTFLSAMLVTVIFVLYLLFRNEPEIKATSVPLSISMFIGCYLQLSYIPVLLVKGYPDSMVAVPHNVTCHFVVWIGGTGVPFPLILATILVKMLRIYATVQNPFSYRKKFFVDRMLLLYIVLLLTPTVLILTLLTIFDPLRIVPTFETVIRGQEIVELCLSAHTTYTWIILPYIYQAILITAVVIVGLKTAPIRNRHFQDAKATNAFVVLAIAVAFMGTIYGYLFAILQPSAENYVNSEMTLSISSLGIVILCQMLLFLPKVYYPVRRCIFNHSAVKKKRVQYITVFS